MMGVGMNLLMSPEQRQLDPTYRKAAGRHSLCGEIRPSPLPHLMTVAIVQLQELRVWWSEKSIQALHLQTPNRLESHQPQRYR